MATYREIQKDVKTYTEKSVKTCWIAHVKELNGLPVNIAKNRACLSERKNHCPPDIRLLIEASMRRLGVLP